MSIRRAGAACLLLAVLAAAGCDAFRSPEQRIAKARAEIAAGDFASAAVELRRAVQAEPRNGQAWLLLAQLALDAGDPRDAQDAIARAVQARVPNESLDPLRARLWLATGRPQALLDAQAKGALALPQPDRSLAIARAYNELDQPARALTVLAPLLVANPRLTEARLIEAQSLVRAGKSDRALSELEQALASDQSSFALPLLQGQILDERGEFAQAEGALALALARMTSATPTAERMSALGALTEARLAQGKVDQAADTETLLATLVPDAPITLYWSARIKLAHRDYAGGVADLERLLEHAPNMVNARMLLGAVQLARGNLEQAQGELTQVVAQTPDNVRARELLASVRLKLDEPEAALRVLTPALGEQAVDPQLYGLLGAAESRVGRTNGVLHALEQAERAHPTNRSLRLNLADAYLRADRAKEALTLLEQTPDVAGDLRRDRLLIAAVGAVRGPVAAAAQVDSLLGAHASDRGVLDLAAEYFTEQRQFDRARILLREALSANPGDVPTLLALAEVEASAGDGAAAERDLRTALATDSRAIAPRLALADLLARERAFDAAQQLLQGASDAAKNPQIQLALARLALARGHLPAATAALDRAVALDPGRAAIVNDAGALLMQANQFDAALARFRRATDLAPDNPEYWQNAGQAQLALDQPTGARESLEKAQQLAPQWLAPVSALTLIDLRAKNYQSALDRVSEFLASHPGDPQGLTLRGDVELASGHPDDAAVAYGQAQSSRPTAAVALKLFRANLAAGGHAKPELPLMQWLALEPHDYAVRRVLGEYFLLEHNPRAAAVEFAQVVEEAPEDLVGLNNLAWIYAELDDPRAESLAERAYRLAPNQPTVRDTLGWILARKHSTARALLLLRGAATADANNPDMQYHYAYVLVQAGERAEARRILSKVLADKGKFDSRQDAEKLLAELKA